MTATVSLVGNTVADPEIRETKTGRANARFNLAVNRRWQNQQSKEWEEETSFFTVICWGDLATNVQDTVTKGMRVVVTGRLRQRSWETDGQKRSVVEVVADEVGPSLRWATADVKRNERSSAKTGSAPSDDDWPDS